MRLKKRVKFIWVLLLVFSLVILGRAYQLQHHNDGWHTIYSSSIKTGAMPTQL